MKRKLLLLVLEREKERGIDEEIICENEIDVDYVALF